MYSFIVYASLARRITTLHFVCAFFPFIFQTRRDALSGVTGFCTFAHAASHNRRILETRGGTIWSKKERKKKEERGGEVAEGKVAKGNIAKDNKRRLANVVSAVRRIFEKSHESRSFHSPRGATRLYRFFAPRVGFSVMRTCYANRRLL